MGVVCLAYILHVVEPQRQVLVLEWLSGKGLSIARQKPAKENAHNLKARGENTHTQMWRGYGKRERERGERGGHRVTGGKGQHKNQL